MGRCEQLVYIPVDGPSGTRKYKAYYKKGGRYLYCNRKDEDVSVEGLHKVYIHEYFPRMLVQRAFAQLDGYLEANRQNTGMYRYAGFWEGALKIAGHPVIPKLPYAADARVDDGYIFISTPEAFRREPLRYCRYDLIEERLSLRYASWQLEHEAPPQDFMDFLFGGLQRFILAQQQLDDGIMPEPYRAAYEEISRINRFMKGKKTVRAWFDGREKGVLCYPQNILTADFIITVENRRFANRPFNYRPDEEGNAVNPRELAALPHKLNYYSEELVLHPELLSALELTAGDPKEQ